MKKTDDDVDCNFVENCGRSDPQAPRLPLAYTFNVQTAAEGSNRYGNANSMYPVLETYTEGSVLEVKVVVSTTHHVSHKQHHFDFFSWSTMPLPRHNTMYMRARLWLDVPVSSVFDAIRLHVRNADPIFSA